MSKIFFRLGFPVFPINGIDKTDNLFLQNGYFRMDNFVHGFFIHIEIFMYKKVAHTCNVPPLHLVMCGLEFICQHSGRFPYNFNVLHNSIVA